jgi:hypothetical protein
MNPLQICYANDAHLRAEQYAGTTAIFVMGRANCIHDEWQRVRDRGSEILKYEIHIERPDVRVSAVDEEIYGGNSATVPLWPYLDANGQQRCHKPGGVPNGAKFTDIRVGSPLVSKYVDHVASVIRSGRYSGLFLDGDGGQLWGAADWNNWPLGERQEWQAGMIDKARRLDEVRRAENPNFLLIGNNTWEYAPAGEQYVNGICIENASITNAACKRLAGNPYSNLGNRRVLTISRTNADALLWSAVPGVTHVISTEANAAAGVSRYAYPMPPVVGYSRIGGGDSSQLMLVTAQRDQALADLAAARADCTAAQAALTAVQQELATSQSDLAAAVQRESIARAAQAESEQRLAAACNAWRALTALSG